MAPRTTANESLTLTFDSSLFVVGFVAGLVLGKLVLRNTMLAVAFGTGLGLAVATTPTSDSGAARPTS